MRHNVHHYLGDLFYVRDLITLDYEMMGYLERDGVLPLGGGAPSA